MPVVTDRVQTLEIIDRFRTKRVSMALLCTQNHWNTEAVVVAARNFARAHGVKDIAVSLGMTFTYKHWPQAVRATYSGDPRAGFTSNMEHLKALCGNPDSPYGDVYVLPHLDHGHPENDKWALTEGLPYLASVMFDAQSYTYDENVELTSRYVERYGGQVVVEGIVDRLGVDERGSAAGGHRRANSTESDDAYAERVSSYMKAAGVDLVVVDLGTEQQSRSVGECRYLGDRARAITRRIGHPSLVLHGTSCLSREQMKGLADDGVLRVNMWTRIVREAGQYAAEQLLKRIEQVREGQLVAADPCQYLSDATASSVTLMMDVFDVLGYARL